MRETACFPEDAEKFFSVVISLDEKKTEEVYTSFDEQASKGSISKVRISIQEPDCGWNPSKGIFRRNHEEEAQVERKGKIF